MHRLNTWKLPFICALAITGLPIGLLLLARSSSSAAAPQIPLAHTSPPLPGISQTGAVEAEISLRDALGRNWVRAEYTGDGHSDIRAYLTNLRGAPLRVAIGSGLIFETGDLGNQMVVARGESFDLPADSQRPAWLQCAATRSSNSLVTQPYHLCPGTLASLDKLFAQADRAPEVSREAIQTAVLLLNENAPLGLFAKFTLLSASQRAASGTTAYQINTGEILAAFDLLRDAGYPRMNLAAAHEPQLKVEAMIDPLSHAMALHYYGIAPNKEWIFWRDQLEKGDPGTRHYALYGIGRYYPNVALQMLPAWARAGHLSELLRTSALQAMAETHRPEAIPALQQLVSEFGAATSLGQSARRSIAYLEAQRAEPADTRLVEFRLSEATLR